MNDNQRFRGYQAIERLKSFIDTTSTRNHRMSTKRERENEVNKMVDFEESKQADVEEDEPEGEAKGKRKRKRKRKKGSKTDQNENTEDQDDGAKSAEGAAMAALEHTVYVEGISFDANEEELRDFFANGGINDIVEMRLPTWQDSGRLRGYGHIVFNSNESTEKALKLTGKYPEGRKRYLSIQRPKPPKSLTVAMNQTVRDQPEGCKTIFVKNLPYDCTEQELLDALSQCGKIIDGGVRLVLNSVTRQPKGFAYVEFKNSEGAASAAKKASKPFGLCVKGRRVFVDFEEKKMKGSFRTSTGRLWSKEHGD